MKNINTFQPSAIMDVFLNNPYMTCITIDKDGLVSFVNQAYLDILEMKSSDVVGKHILEITPDSKLPEILHTQKTDPLDLWSINEQDAIAMRLPIKQNDEVIGAIGLSIPLDATGTKILTRKLQEMQKELSTVSEVLVQSPNMIYLIIDKNGIITFLNQTYLDLLKMQKEDVVGKNVLDIIPKSKLPEILKTGEIHEVDTWTINGHDTIITRTPIVENGEITGAVGRSIFLDMSGAKMLVNKLLQAKKELNFYKEEVRQIYRAKWQFKDLIGGDSEFCLLKSMAQQLSHTGSTILITGESGTGKELFAQAIHNNSNREGPFVRINCATLPEHLLESELFGYEEGAFTGARKGGKPGKFELAKDGTIFLDEIGDMPLNMQTKLLSVLQERVVERVGGTSPIAIKIRVIAATNKNMEKMVARKEFREDLYYRLNVVRINIPPLKSRIDDLPLLVENLIARINSQLHTSVYKWSDQAMDLLKNYTWPGNVRELENLLERAINIAVLNQDSCLSVEHFSSLYKGKVKHLSSGERTYHLGDAVDKLEKETIERVLIKNNYNKSQTAKVLGLNKSVLYRKLKKYNLMIE